MLDEELFFFTLLFGALAGAFLGAGLLIGVRLWKK